MENQEKHFWHILLFYYRKTKLCDVYGEDVLTERQCQNWFAKFRFGNLDVEDPPSSGRHGKADEHKIKVL